MFIFFSQANIGQDEDFEAVKEKALKFGALKVRKMKNKLHFFSFNSFLKLYGKYAFSSPNHQNFFMLWFFLLVS